MSERPNPRRQDTLLQRSSLEEQVAGSTICLRFRDIAEEHPDAPAYSIRAEHGWETLTFGEARREVLAIAAGFVALGLAPGDTVTLMMVNRPEHVLADLGAVHAGGRPISVYATLAPEQVTYIARDSEAKIAVLGGEYELKRWGQALAELPGLTKVIVLDPAACPDDERFMTWEEFVALGKERYDTDAQSVDERWRAVKPHDTLTVLYTSGTTGNPKGVPLSHHSVCYNAAGLDLVSDLPTFGTQISYLTYAHIAERVLSLYLPLFKGSHVHFCPDVTQLSTVLREVRPVLFFGVPRVWEKLMAGLLAVMETQPEEQQTQARAAMAAGVRFIEAGQNGGTPSAEVVAAYERADAGLLSIVRSLIGFDRARWLASSAAPLSSEVQRFFAGLGMNVMEVYGMTETTGAFTVNSPHRYKLGSVGAGMPGIEIRIADDGEILMRGPIATAGYLNLPEATSDLIDEDGWLHTGDVGSLDNDGFVRILDRKKEIFITSGGENISPANIENYLKEHPLIGQALAYGDRRPYPVALITLDAEAAPAWATNRGITFTGLADLTQHPDVLAEVTGVVNRANERLARVQQIKRWKLLPVEWSTDTEELTPKFSLRRRVIHTKYSDTIELLYGTG
ncbi:AMP-dependent synthetase/ligase [Sinosporangium siamense]|uniref:Acyl-CoA synthetase n=1 Tax=Sinosporangium siamense TaxID=1367973 RepID=A0A919V8X0_9ACTN|nr:AMP-dependent synthetase/ligase [Sinosporangium siamense]GII94878.1 long-chain acyl-CoA synthetase [Sinosporangium siamense]